MSRSTAWPPAATASPRPTSTTSSTTRSGQRLISTIFTQSNQYRVVLEVKAEFSQGVESLGRLHVPSPAGTEVFLSNIARFTEKPAQLAISRYGQFRSSGISFNLAGDASLGDAVTAINRTEKELGMPVSIETSFQGAAGAFETALKNELWLIVAAIVTMYIVLGVLYESYIHPITILSTLPSAGVGALLALMVSGSDLNVIGIIGIILLIGIVKKNAIMMIDFALEAQREGGLAPQEAIHQACLLRFRPILMTTMAALLGALPLMLGRGMGSELREPLGITMVGGLIVSQMLTLFTTPVIYLWFDKIGRKLGFADKPREVAAPAETEENGSAQAAGATHPMSLSALFIRRPVATTLLTLAIALVGVIAFRLMPVAPMPQVDSPTIQVSASIPGASPEVMAATVATPLERSLGRIAGINELTSNSTRGQTSITIQFDLSRNIDGAAREVQAAINAARTLLPATLITNPTYKKSNPVGRADHHSRPDFRPLHARRNFTIRHPRSSPRKSRRSSGVGQVTVGGGALPGRARGTRTPRA